MLIQKLLTIHEAHQPLHHLPDSVGDGYMLAHSDICAQARAQLIAAGGRFSTTPPFPYYAIPLLALEHIYRTRVVPYVPNVDALRDLESRRAGVTTTDDLNSFMFRRNFVMHETNHVLFRTLVPESDPLPGFTTKQQDIVKAILVESFADAVEILVASEQRPSDKTMAIMLHLNGNHIERVGSLAREARAILGRTKALCLFLASSAAAQFLAVDIDAKGIDARLAPFIDLSRLSTAERKVCRGAFREGLDIDARFRLKTVPSYLRLRGHNGDAFKMLDFDSEEVLNNPTVVQQIQTVCAFFGNGVKVRRSA